MTVDPSYSETRDKILNAIREAILTPEQIAQEHRVSVRTVNEIAAKFEYDMRVRTHLMRLRVDRDRLDAEIQKVSKIFWG